ncbi:unnamed protein product [Brugia pahangi]|uniref:PDZ domain-containing protein n=1 Tax=Brugia pahangi TaxID=6280 RepID=A0A0N4TY95_BRUPA|nr:unnamed protein product [Brugia pahangi]
MEIQRHSELGNDSNEMPSPGGFNLRLTVPKKHYSVQRNDSLQFIITPVFDKAMMQKKTPSSPGTVLTVAGFLQSSEEKERHEEVIIETNNEGLGMRVDENLHVIEITKQGPCDGKLLPGDHIIQINNVRDSMNRINETVKIGDRTVQTVDEAREAIEAAGVSIRIVFDRGLQSTTQDNIPEQYESLFKRREGFTYHYVQINYVKGCKFGLGIKHFQNNVIVSRIDPGSLAAQSLQEKDHIIDINGIKVTDKEVARSLLVRALKKKNFVSMCIERPVSGKAKEWADDAMNASQMQPPSVAMASDVQEIAARQQQKMMEAMDTKKPGIMKKNINKGGGSDHARIVKIAPGERQDVS